MNFKDQKVKQAVYEHLQFAISSVEAVLPVVLANESMNGETQFLKNMADNMRLTLISQILTFTLVRDFRLANSLNGLIEADVPPGRRLQDMVL